LINGHKYLVIIKKSRSQPKRVILGVSYKI
jgi:hypothetical protein